MAVVYISVGSNIGDRKANIADAVSRLQVMPGVTLLAASSFYMTAPAGGPPQDDYLNGVLEFSVGTGPEHLLKTLKSVERDMGRRRRSLPNFPRIIDLDILFYESKVVRKRGLIIPHPRAHERFFVLKGMVELAPDMAHPITGRTMSAHYENIMESAVSPRESFEQAGRGGPAGVFEGHGTDKDDTGNKEIHRGAQA